MVRTYILGDDNERSVLPIQGPFCIWTRDRDHGKNGQDMHASISIDLGKLDYRGSDWPLAERR
jgi:hypothetical protein